jgi:colanic acid/amylovoran biosynthesis protein
MKVLLFFHGGSDNRGCEAIARTATNLLRTDSRIQKLALSSTNPESDKVIPHIDVIHFNKDAKIEKFSLDGIINAVNIKFLKNESFALQKIHKAIIDLIPEYDVFVSIGGDNYCYGEQPGIYEIDRSIKKAGKKLILWGASIGEEDLSEDKIKDLKTFDLLLVRESFTYQVLKNAGIDKVKLVADGAFLMERKELALPENWKEGDTIGFNFSPLILKRNPESKEAAFALVQHILDTTDSAVCFIPHVIIPGNNDYEILEEFYNKFKNTGRVSLIPDNLDATEYKGYIARTRFFIGARTHATIAAYSSQVPTMVIGYSIKSKGIANDIFGKVRLVLDIKESSDAQKLIAKFDEMKADEAELREILKTKIPEVRKNSEKAAQYFFDLK